MRVLRLSQGHRVGIGKGTLRSHTCRMELANSGHHMPKIVAAVESVAEDQQMPASSATGPTC